MDDPFKSLKEWIDYVWLPVVFTLIIAFLVALLNYLIHG